MKSTNLFNEVEYHSRSPILIYATKHLKRSNDNRKDFLLFALRKLRSKHHIYMSKMQIHILIEGTIRFATSHGIKLTESSLAMNIKRISKELKTEVSDLVVELMLTGLEESEVYMKNKEEILNAYKEH